MYIIHQILAFGSFQRIRELFQLYSKQEVIRTFVGYPKKIYSAPVFFFVKNYILDLHSTNLLRKKYVTA